MRQPVANASTLWRYGLIAIGSASSLFYPHVPLVGFAAVAGLTLSRQQAIAASVLIWFVNQVYGFTVRHYPLTAIALLWGLTMGLGAVAVALIASLTPRFFDHSWVRQAMWLGIALVLGSLAYQSSALFVNQWIKMHGLTSDVFLRIFVRDAVWAIALYTLYTIFVFNPQLRSTQR